MPDFVVLQPPEARTPTNMLLALNRKLVRHTLVSTREGTTYPGVVCETYPPSEVVVKRFVMATHSLEYTCEIVTRSYKHSPLHPAVVRFGRCNNPNGKRSGTAGNSSLSNC